MICGTGVDIVKISRFQRFIEEGNDSIFRRLFTTDEISYCAGKKFSSQHYALRFAAKEAFLKACGTGLRGGMSWHDIEVRNDQLGKPELALSGAALQLFNEHAFSNIFVSLSHDGDYAIGMVIIER